MSRVPGEPLLPDYFKIYREDYVAYAKAQFEYGKWLLTTLVAIHAGALFVIASSDGARYLLDGDLLLILVSGIFVGLLSGLFTWWNWSLHQDRNFTLSFDQLAESPSVKFDYLGRRINFSFWAALSCGVLSGLMIPVAAIDVWRTMPEQTARSHGWEFSISFKER